MVIDDLPGSINMRGMVIKINDEQLRRLADLHGFLDGTVTMEFMVAED